MKKFSLKRNVCVTVSKSIEIPIRDSLYKLSIDLINAQVRASVYRKTYDLFTILIRDQIWSYSRFNSWVYQNSTERNK
jgi:hypothetical protein